MRHKTIVQAIISSLLVIRHSKLCFLNLILSRKQQWEKYNLAKLCKQNLIWARKTTSSTSNFLKPLLIIQVWKMNVSISEILVRSQWPNKRRVPLCSEYFNDSEAVARLSTAIYAKVLADVHVIIINAKYYSCFSSNHGFGDRITSLWPVDCILDIL